MHPVPSSSAGHSPSSADEQACLPHSLLKFCLQDGLHRFLELWLVFQVELYWRLYLALAGGCKLVSLPFGTAEQASRLTRLLIWKSNLTGLLVKPPEQLEPLCWLCRCQTTGSVL